MIATTAKPSTDLPPAIAGSGQRWIGLVVGLIAMNMAIVATTIYFATSDRSSGIEPDYYARALHFEREIQQRRTNQQLGWTSIVTLTAAPEGASAILHMQLLDAERRTISGALARAEAFSNLRSRERNSLQLREVADGYVATVPISAEGEWRIRCTVTHGTNVFTDEQDVMLVRKPTVAADEQGGSAR